MKRKAIIIWAILVAAVLFAMWIVPIIQKQITLNGINKQIRAVELQNATLSGEINQLSMDRKKCEDLQVSASDQAAGKRGEMTKNDNEILNLKMQYNAIAGFTQG